MMGNMSVSSPDRIRFERAVLPQLDAAYNLARWLTRNATDAEDVVQEACERALKYFGAFRGGDAKAWFLTIVRHACYDWLKRNRPAEIVPGDGESIEEISDPDAPTPEQVVTRRSSAVALSDAIAALPIGYREVLILREIEELPYKEIARVVDIPIGTVMSRLARARSLLQRSPVLRAIRDRAAL
jgi:RNA polymerase sigma-70 factor, ECF subfamily